MKLFTWHDFKNLNDIGPESLADYCNMLAEQRTTPLRLDKYAHNVVRADANYTEEFLNNYPLKSRMFPVEVPVKGQEK